MQEDSSLASFSRNSRPVASPIPAAMLVLRLRAFSELCDSGILLIADVGWCMCVGVCGYGIIIYIVGRP